MKKVRATLGFVFSQDFEQVLLVRKRHPEWQAGRINGLGGKCLAKESGPECIAREVKEESGLRIAPPDWRMVTEIVWELWRVEVFSAVYLGELKDAQTLTDEEVEWFVVKELPTQVMSNLRWLIPLALDQRTNPTPPTLKQVWYPSENDDL